MLEDKVILASALFCKRKIYKFSLIDCNLSIAKSSISTSGISFNEDFIFSILALKSLI